MVRSANLFCFRQKTLTNKQQSLGEDFLQRNNCCICYFVRGRPAPVHFIKLRGERRQQEDIFAHRQSSIWKDTFSGDENKFLAGTGVRGHTIYLTLSSSDSGVHLSRLPQQQDLCHWWCSPLSSTTSLWAVVVADVLVVLAIFVSNLGVVCCFEILHQ